MSKAGQNTFKGINTQAKASLLLFLMNLKIQDFDSVVLEDSNWEDFTLSFKSGKKIIGESKDRKRQLSWAEVKGILSSIEKKSQLNKTDEVLIVCNQVNHQLESNIEYLKYDFPETKKLYKNNGYTDSLISILSKTKFFKIESDEFLYQEALTYFAEQIPYWVPEDDLQMFMDYILVHKIYDKSQKGAVFTKAELIQEIDEYKKRKIKDSYAYDPERKSLEDQLRTQLSGVSDTTQRDRILNSRALTAITAQPNLGFFLLEYIKQLKDVHLAEFDELWKATLKRLYTFSSLLIFEKRIDNLDNASYIVKFLDENYTSLSSPIRDTFNQEFAIELVTKIYDKHSLLLQDVFSFVKKVLSLRKDSYTQLDLRHDIQRERDLLAELLYKLFIGYKNKNEADRLKEIVDLVYEHFDLVSDDSRHNLFSPNEVFLIIKEHVEIDPDQNLDSVISQIIKQYQAKEWYKNFKGWELSGGGISQSGSDFSISDRHFVTLVLAPSLKNFYHQDKEKAWKLILAKCIARNIPDVNKKKPDFLNRASLPILFEEYKSGKHSKEAFEILSDFVRMRKGIPWKADFIFQELRGDYVDEQKWALIKVSLDEYNSLPVNVFVEQIVSDLAKKEHKESIKTIAKWVKNPEYNRRQTIGSFNVMENISKILDNPKTFDEGVVIYKNYITSEDFVKKDNDWETWDVAKVLAKIISTRPEVGVEILKEVSSSKTLTQNQQILLCSSINDLEKDNRQLLEKVQKDFVLPLLQSLDNDITKFEKRITNRHSREQVVQFAEKLIEVGLWDEALSIVEIFINDSDPILKNYPDDEKGDFNEHKKVKEGEDSFAIRTVRGWCAWVLQKLVIPRDFARINETRRIIEQSLPLLEKLVTDPNYYVRIQATVPLTELAKNRNTVLPENREERFVSPEIAKHVGDLAYLMLRSSENHKLPAVMKHLAMVFTYMRSLPQKEAWEILQTFLKDDYPKKNKQRGHESYLADILNEAAPLYIFFAEFRSKAFKDWPKDWGSLGVFDDKPFKDLLVSLLKSDDPDIRRVFTWQIARLPNEVKNKPEFDSILKLTRDYLMIATTKYDHGAFENIYRFVEDYIDKDEYFEMCFDLWKACIKTESKFFKDNFSKDRFQEMYWWPFFYNGKVLMRIAVQKGNDEFLKWFKVLIDYPVELYLANDLDVAVEHLITIKTDKQVVESLLDRLMEKNSKYYEFKQRWMNLDQAENN